MMKNKECRRAHYFVQASMTFCCKYRRRFGGMCNTLQSMSECHMGVMVIVIVKSENNTHTLRVHVFDKVISDIRAK